MYPTTDATIAHQDTALLDVPKRVEITLSPSDTIIPFDYQNMLADVINDILRSSDVTDTNSLYSFSWLRTSEGAAYKVVPETGFRFHDGAKFSLSSYYPELIDEFIGFISDDPEYPIIGNMTVEQITAVEPPEFKPTTRLFLTSPALVKKTVGGVVRHLTYDDPEAAVYMSNTIKAKLEAVGIDGDAFLRFDNRYSKAKMKLVRMNNIMNKCSICPVIVEASSAEVVEFIWTVGVGHHTGDGFGSVM